MPICRDEIALVCMLRSSAESDVKLLQRLVKALMLKQGAGVFCGEDEPPNFVYACGNERLLACAMTIAAQAVQQMSSNPTLLYAAVAVLHGKPLPDTASPVNSTMLYALHLSRERA